MKRDLGNMTNILLIIIIIILLYGPDMAKDKVKTIIVMILSIPVIFYSIGIIASIPENISSGDWGNIAVGVSLIITTITVACLANTQRKNK